MLSNLVELKRKMTKVNIDNNPIDITINRKTYTLNDKGYKDLTNTSHSIRIRLTNTNNASIVNNDNAGRYVMKKGLTLLGEYDVDMKADSNNEDFFDYENNTYKITSIMINREKGYITSVQAIAEKYVL